MKNRQKKAEALLRSLHACVENGSRLLDETYDLEYERLAATRYYITMVAQEEFAKAFILFLIRAEVIEMGPAISRAMNDHTCKQLVGMVMDYAIMHWESMDDLNAAISRDASLPGLLPNDVGSAIEILRYEKVGRWEGRGWTSDDPAYDASALSVAEGKKDRRKQDALYVRLGRDGQLASTPSVISEQERAEEYERARRYLWFVRSLVEGSQQTYRYERVVEAFRMLFSTPVSQPA